MHHHLFGFIELFRVSVLASALFLVPLIATAADLEVTVEGVHASGGVLRVGLYDRANAARYPHADAVLTTLTRPADAESVTVVFSGLSPGEYALAALHDADEDGDMTQNFLGLPQEGYGFSNDAKGFLGPPSFRAARVRIEPNAARVTTIVTLFYP